MRCGRRQVWLAMALAMVTAPAQADVKAGVDAWTKGDFEMAVGEWLGPATQGDADAQFNLAQAYKLGRGVKPDLAKAEELFGKAAAQGHWQASDNYGLLLFQRGERAKALPYIIAGSDRGDPRAQYLLGIAHFNGDNVPKDWVRAYALVSLAQQSGLTQATAGAVADGPVRSARPAPAECRPGAGTGRAGPVDARAPGRRRRSVGHGAPYAGRPERAGTHRGAAAAGSGDRASRAARSGKRRCRLCAATGGKTRGIARSARASGRGGRRAEARPGAKAATRAAPCRGAEAASRAINARAVGGKAGTCPGHSCSGRDVARHQLAGPTRRIRRGG